MPHPVITIVSAVLLIIVLAIALNLRKKIIADKAAAEAEAAKIPQIPTLNINRICALYFSATGTTEKIVTRIAEELSEMFEVPCIEHDFTLPAAREEDYFYGPGDLVIAAVPTYAGRVPNVLLPFLKEKIHGQEGAIAVPVVLFGNRNFDDSLIELRDLLEAAGLRTVAGAAFIGEHSFSRILGAGRPDDEDMIKADEFTAAVYARISQLTELPKEPAFVDGSEPIRPYYTPRDRHGESINILKVKPETDTEKCIKCGVCARVCPMGSIDPQDVTQFTGICIKCGACEKKCPEGAKFYTDEGYLYHKTELEEMYERRAEPSLY